MNIDDLLYSLRCASRSDEDARAMLARLDAADARLLAIPPGRAHVLKYNCATSDRDTLRREAATLVTARDWFRRLPSDDYDGSYVGHEDR